MCIYWKQTDVINHSQNAKLGSIISTKKQKAQTNTHTALLDERNDFRFQNSVKEHIWLMVLILLVNVAFLLYIEFLYSCFPLLVAFKNKMSQIKRSFLSRECFFPG
jgi:hypothetical protein